jgi:hypothetical protein
MREDVTVSVVLPVQPLRVPAAETRHPGRERWLWRVEDQVEMRTHQAVRLAMPRMSLDHQTELAKEFATIG